MSDTFTTRRRFKLGAAAVGLFVLGGAAGGFAGHAFHPPIAMAPVHAVAIRTLTDDGGIVTVKGRVAERYGNQFTIEDGTGKALIDAGRAGEDDAFAPKGAIVSVQGRFDHGTLHPMFLVDPSGKVVAVEHGPGHGPHGHGLGPADDDGPRDGAGPDRGPPPAAPAPQNAN